MDVAGDPGGVRFDGDGDRAAAGNGCGGQDPVDVVDGAGPRAYAVYVDEQDVVWLSDFGADTVVRFDPVTEAFTTVEVPGGAGDVRQILGRPGEIWCPASARDLLFVVRTVA